MTEEESTPPPPAPDPPAADSGIRGELDALRSDVDDALALAHSAVQMQLEDEDDVDEPAEEEHTEVETRGGAPVVDDKKGDATSTPPAKHSGLFL